MKGNLTFIAVIASILLIIGGVYGVIHYERTHLSQSVIENTYENIYGYSLERRPVEVKGYFDNIDKPYRLKTSYKNEIVYDYGTFKYIDSLKCIRYNQMEKRIPLIDSLELAEERFKKIIVDERKKGEDAREKELELLNKSCKN